MLAKDNLTADQEEKSEYQKTPHGDGRNRAGAITENGVVRTVAKVLTVWHAVVVGIGRTILDAATSARLDLVGIRRTSVTYIAESTEERFQEMRTGFENSLNEFLAKADST